MGADVFPLAADLGAARSQMAFTLGFHIVLASIGVGFPAVILDRELSGAEARRRRRAWPRAALVEGGGCHLRGRGDHRDRAVVRAGSPVAGVHAPLRRCLRAGLRARGDLLLHRGDLHGDLHLRLEAPVGLGALLDRGSGRARRPRRRLVGGGGQLLDEPTGRLQARLRRDRDRREPAGRVLQRSGRLRGPAHDPGGVPRHRLSGRVGLRRRHAARPARPPPPARAADPADVGGDRHSDPVRRGRHRRPRDRQGPARQVRRDGVRAADAHTRNRVHRRALHLRGREGRDRDPWPRFVARRVQHGHQGDRARLRTARRASTGEHAAALGVRRDGGHLQRSDRAGGVARDLLVAQARHPKDAVVLAGHGDFRGGGNRGARVRLDRDGGRPPALDRLRGDAHGGRGHPGRGCLGQPGHRAGRLHGAGDRDRARAARDGAPLAGRRNR